MFLTGHRDSDFDHDNTAPLFLSTPFHSTKYRRPSQRAALSLSDSTRAYYYTYHQAGIRRTGCARTTHLIHSPPSQCIPSASSQTIRSSSGEEVVLEGVELKTKLYVCPSSAAIVQRVSDSRLPLEIIRHHHQDVRPCRRAGTRPR